MDLLTNAVESIQVGVEDYLVGTRPRLLSAIRNVHAGILLLYKEALLRRSPPDSNEALIKAKIEPKTDVSGAVTFVGSGRKTVEIHQIQERFASLGIATDWKLLKSITDARNDIEHYYPKLTQEALTGVIASAFLIIRTFTVEELGEEPRELLGQQTWEAMLRAATVHTAERQACEAALAAFAWDSDVLSACVKDVKCSDCGSDLLRPTDGTADVANAVLECRVCRHTIEADVFVPMAIAEGLAWDAYVAVKDGGDEPYGECPECGLPTYVFAEARCAYCGESAATECDRCGTTIPTSEIGCAPLCGYCDHVMSKDD